MTEGMKERWRQGSGRSGQDGADQLKTPVRAGSARMLCNMLS